MNALFPYPGSKWNLMKQLIPLLPAHDHYVSVFGGSGAEILAKPPSLRETFNDLDEEVYNVFRTIQNEHDADRLAAQVEIPLSRDFYNQALQVIREPIRDSVVSAAAFLVVAYQGLNVGHPLLKRRCNWRILPEVCKVRKWLALPATIRSVGNRLRQVHLENRHWSSVIREYDSPGTVFFIDPPYYPGTVARLYYETMTQAEHPALLAAINRLQGKAIICNYANPLYDQALSGWHRQEFLTAANLTGHRLPRTEVVWLNYNPNATALWLPP